MSRHILIDLNEMTVLKAVDSVDALKCCEYWADILIPKGEFYICGTEKRDLTIFDDEEIRRLINSLADLKRKPNSYSEVLGVLRELMDAMYVDDKTIKQLKRKLGHKLKEQPVLPVGKLKKAPAIPKRPASGTDAVKPWEAADWFFKKQKNFVKVWKKTMAICKKEGLTEKMINKQFGLWKAHKCGEKL